MHGKTDNNLAELLVKIPDNKLIKNLFRENTEILKQEALRIGRIMENLSSQ